MVLVSFCGCGRRSIVGRRRKTRGSISIIEGGYVREGYNSNVRFFESRSKIKVARTPPTTVAE